MLQRTLGRTGISVSSLGFGAEPIGRDDLTPDDADVVLNGLLDAGITLLDTASAYGVSEEYIGRFIRHRRDEFTLVTKCGWTDDWQPARSPESMKASIDRSLRRLRVEHVDILLLHGSPLGELQSGQSTAALQQARDQGKTRFIGISDDNESLQWSINQGFLDVVEASYNLCDQANGPLVAEAAARGLGVLIKRPLANAVPGRNSKPERPYARQYWSRWRAMGLPDHPEGADSWVEAALRFAAFAPGVHCALVGSTSLRHISSNIEHLERGPLVPAFVSRLRRSFAEVAAPWPALS